MRVGVAVIVLLTILLPGAAATSAEAPATRAILSLEPGAEVPSIPGLQVLHAYRLFPGALVQAPPDLLARLPAYPGVRGVYPDEPLERHLDLAVPVLGLAGAEAPPERGAGVAVAIVDAGIDPNHPGLRGRVESYAVTTDGVAPAALTQDPSAHGTHVAGVLAGDGAGSPGTRYRGVAPGARIVGLDLGASFSVDGALRAFEWIHDNHQAKGIRVVTNSWGRAGAVDGRFDPNAPLVRATDVLALEDGLLVVFSAGNRGGASTIASEALNPNVLTVGATDAGGRLASFSSRGPGLDAAGAPLAWTKPDLVAVGDRVVSARGGLTAGVTSAADRSLAPAFYIEQSGTSVAAPMVAGAAALLLEANPDLTREDLARILVATARDLGAPGADADTGAGLLDPALALQLARAGSLARGTATREVAVSFPSDLVAVAGIVTRYGPSPSAQVGGEFVGYLPVLPGTAALDAEVAWTATGAPTFTAHLLKPDGTEGGALRPDGSRLRATVPAPEPGVWQVRVKPGAGFYQATLALAGASAAVRDVPAVASLDGLALAGGAAPDAPAAETPDLPLTAALAAVGAAVVLRAARRR